MKQFTVTDFGAISGVEAPQTEAIQKALDACFLAGGGEVIIPAGMSFVTGDIRIRSNTTLHLLENATLLGSKDAKDYLHIHDDAIEPLPEEQNTRLLWDYNREIRGIGPEFKAYLYTAGSHWNYGLIRAVYAENIAIIGEKGSKIDGRNPYDPEGEENYRGPHGINMHFCKNVTFHGYTIEQAGNWAHAIFQSEGITFENLTVYAGHDALHTRSCSKVLMSGCKLITGDDCVAGFDNLDVVIRDCEISSACSAFRYGGNNILVENCNIWGPCPYQFRGSFSREEKIAGVMTSEKGRNNMLSFWTNFVSKDLPVRKPAGKVLIRNCTVKNADRMLHLNLSGNEPWQKGTPPTDITFENIKIEGVKMGLTAYGIESSPMEITLRNVEYSYAEGAEETPLLRVAHCSAINLENVKVSGFAGTALIRAWSDNIKVNTKDLDCNLGDGKLIVRADEEFVCRRI
ncbi:MAG: right-handed parallel beta-helix repeat-containing protein [Clostridia bacterium]|nr:right-handed parallel beta-helix repeat-containing protein [Clostridia bacterium]